MSGSKERVDMSQSVQKTTTNEMIYLPSVVGLSDVDVTDGVPCIQAPSSSVDVTISSLQSPIAFADYNAFGELFGQEMHAIKQIEATLEAGQSHVNMLYTYRSVSRAIPMVNVNIPQDASPEEKAEFSSRQNEINQEIVNILEPVIQKLRELASFVSNAVSLIRDIIASLSKPEARERVIPEGLYTAMIRLFDIMVKLDNLKDMKACLNNDYSRYKRASRDNSDYLILKFISNEKQIIHTALRGEVKLILGHEEVLLEIIEQALLNLNKMVYVTPDEMFSYLRVLPHLMLLTDGDLSEPNSFNIFKHKSMSNVQKLMKQYPVVPLCGDMPITLFCTLCQIPHFDRLAMGKRWGETPNQSTLAFYSILSHWKSIKTSYNEFVVNFTSTMTKVDAHPFAKQIDSNNLEIIVYNMVKDGFLRLSQWTACFMQILAWKYSHPADIDSVSGSKEKPGFEYERALKCNFTSGEYDVIVDIISMIKSQAGLLAKVESKLAPFLRRHIHDSIQQLVQVDLLPLLHQCEKSGKETLLKTVLSIRNLAADWERAPTEDYKLYSKKQRRVEAIHQPRVVGPGYTQLQILRSQIRSLYCKKSVFRKKSAFFGRADVETEDANVFEAFYYDSFFYQYALNFSQTVRELSDLGDLWYREFFLDMTRCVQFPLEISFPWILTEHVITSKVRDVPIFEEILHVLDIYNDAAHRALYVLHEQFLYDEIEAEANLVFDQMVFFISGEMYSYYKNFAATNALNVGYDVMRGDLTRLKPPFSCLRYHIPLEQRHLQLLGRSIDLNYLIGQHINNAFFHDVEAVIKTFEGSSYSFVVELNNLLSVLRNAHIALSEYIEIDNFDCILSQVNESYSPVSFSSRIAMHMAHTVTMDLFVNCTYHKDTERFVQSPLPPKPMNYNAPSKKSASNVQLDSANGIVFTQLASMTKNFFGKPHVAALLAVLNPSDLPILVETCIAYFEDIFLSLRVYVEALPDSVMPCKLPSFVYNVDGCFGYFEGIFRPILEYDDLKSEVFQRFREIGNLICFMKCLSSEIEARKCFGFVNTVPLYGSSNNSNPCHAFDLKSSPLGSMMLDLLRKFESAPFNKQLSGCLDNVMDDIQSSMLMCVDEYAHSKSLFCHALRRFENMLKKHDTLSDWTDQAPLNDAINAENSSGFHRLWSTLSFLFCVQEDTTQVNSDDNVVDLDQFGDGFAAAGCFFLHILGQRDHFELLDFSYHILNVHQHEMNTTTPQSRAKGGRVHSIPGIKESATAFVANAKRQREAYNYFLSMYKNECAMKTSEIVKIFHPPLPGESLIYARVRSSKWEFRRDLSSSADDSTDCQPQNKLCDTAEVHDLRQKSQIFTDEDVSNWMKSLVKCARMGNYEEVVRLKNDLLSVKSHLNYQDENGYSALLAAARGGHSRVVKLLIDDGADVELSDLWSDYTAVTWASFEGHGRVVRLLMESQADLDRKSYHSGTTPVIAAAENGHANVTRLLVDACADLEEADDMGCTAVMKAVETGNGGVVNIFLHAGTDIEIKDTCGRTAVMLAASNGHKNIVENLIDAGADVNVENNRGETALDVARSNEVRDVMHKCSSERTGKIKFRKMREELKYEGGSSALMKAACSGQFNIVKQLINTGADMEEIDVWDGCTPLLKAIDHQHEDVVKLLIKSGASLDARDHWHGSTAITKASENGQENIVNSLVNAGASLESEDDNGCTALILALHNGHNDVVTALVDAGARMDGKAKGVWTPLVLAERFHHNEVKEFRKRVSLNWKASPSNK